MCHHCPSTKPADQSYKVLLFQQSEWSKHGLEMSRVPVAVH